MIQNENIICFGKVYAPVKRVLFLGYGRSKTKIIDVVIDKDCEVYHTEDLINENVDFDLIVSFGYRHILRKNVIEGVGCKILNLHISYLPFNKGAHPNFWSFFEGTPSGVTIHVVNEGVDTGPIVYQRYVNFDNGEITFRQTYDRLMYEVEDLFISKINNILSDDWVARPQRGKGSVHFLKDLPSDFSGWDSDIEDELKRLDKIMDVVDE